MLAIADYLLVVTKQTYWKAPFEWTRAVPPRDDPVPPGLIMASRENVAAADPARCRRTG
jgi:hypothetical protein